MANVFLTISIVVAIIAAMMAVRAHRTAIRLRNEVNASIAVLQLAESAQPHQSLRAAAMGIVEQLGDAEARAELLSEAIAAAGFGVLVVDEAGLTVFANPAAQRYARARHGDALAEEQLRKLIKKVTKHRRNVRKELELFTPTRRVMGLHGVPLEDGDGHRRGAAIFLEDLTARRRVDAIRKDFVANASHELKTPLGALSILSEALATTDDLETRQRLADRLALETTRMSRLVDDILDLSLVEGTAGETMPLAIDEVIADAVKHVDVSGREAGVPIETSHAGPGVLIAGDRHQLVSAFSNLLENAIKYTSVAENDPAVAVQVAAREQGDAVVVEVADRGIGMAQQHLDRIFERFYRIDPARSRETGGTGLGLAIVRHVVLNHGGTIEVDSELGVGSTFRIELPRWSE
jgi:two-component system sensor histidine kinase SenX3